MQNYENVQVNTVDELPWEIDGLQIYKKQSTMDFWWDETKDGRWWKVSDSSHSSLNGERKFLTCTGSYVCNNSTCSKLTSEGVKNRNHFIQAKGGSYTCHSCGYYIQKEYCGAMKILEFDIDTNYITAYHYGNHISWPKQNKKQQLQYAEDATLNQDLRKTPRELKIDLIGYYLARGEIEKAVEVADKMSDNRVIEKLHYLTKDGGQKLLCKTEVDSLTNIKTLKETTDKKDKFYMYKMNCKSVSGEPSYVFKTLTKALEIAKRMEQKETEGQPTNSLSLEWAYMDGMHSRVRGYKTLTLWTYHPGINKVMALAIMECQNKNTQMIKHFLQTFNKCLQDYTGI